VQPEAFCFKCTKIVTMLPQTS